MLYGLGTPLSSCPTRHCHSSQLHGCGLLSFKIILYMFCYICAQRVPFSACIRDEVQTQTEVVTCMGLREWGSAVFVWIGSLLLHLFLCEQDKYQFRKRLLLWWEPWFPR